MYLHEAWVIYQLNPLHEGKKFQIFTTLIFYELYLESSPREHNLLCELYSFDFILEHDTLWNPNTLVGDIHLKYFMSFIQNQIKWEFDMKFLIQCEFLCELHVREDHHTVVEMFNSHEEILMEKEKAKVYRFNKRKTLRDFEEINNTTTVAALVVSDKRGHMSFAEERSHGLSIL